MVDEIIVFREASPAAAISQLEAGEMDLYAQGLSDPNLLRTVQSSPNLDYSLSYGNSVDLAFNPVGPEFPGTGRLNPFAVPRVREAMNYLLDRDYIAQEVYGGMAVPRYTILDTASPDYARLADVARILERKYAYDPDKAAQMIGEEMVKLGAERIGDRWYYKGEPVVIRLLIRTEDRRRELGDYVANQLEQIGFTVEREYRSAAQAAPVWTSADPARGLFHIYTGAWVSTAIIRDLAAHFELYYTPRGWASPLWQAYRPSQEFDELASRLARRDFATLAERRELMARALELSLEDSVRVWLLDETVFTPRRKEIRVASDLAGGVTGTALWALTLRKGDQPGGRVRVGLPNVLVEPWNPLDGSNWAVDMMLVRATEDNGVVPDPWTGLTWPQRIERAEVTVKEGLPVQKNLDWVELDFAAEIPVPADAWIDWDPVNQRFITVGERYPEGLTANRRSVVYYPKGLYDIPLHDGTRWSLADFIFGMILTFDRGKPESPIYDESYAPAFERFMMYFRGVRIRSVDPLVIETYSDLYGLDAESGLNVSTWFPSYGHGPGPWHTVALGLMAEAAGELAYSKSKADKLEVEWTNFISGPSLHVLERYLREAESTAYIPYRAVLGQYVTEAEAAERWAKLRQWYEAKGHFWVGSGPFYVERVYPVAGIIHLRKFEGFPDPSDKWLRFEEAEKPELELSGPVRVKSGAEAEFTVEVTVEGEPYPIDHISQMTYLVFDSGGELVLTGEAKPGDDGYWRIELDSEATARLSPGVNRLEVVAVPRLVSLPAYASMVFVSTP